MATQPWILILFNCIPVSDLNANVTHILFYNEKTDMLIEQNTGTRNRVTIRDN